MSSRSAAPSRSERAAIAESFTQLGPAAPTILPGWDAPDLLEHLLLRERYPQLAAGARIPGPWSGPARAGLERFRALSWADRVELLREGPGRWSPVGALDRLGGDAELLIHHEDLRRAQDGWEARDLEAAQQQRIWRTVIRMAPLSVRLRADLTLVSPLGGTRRRRRESAGTLRVHGEPLELLLWINGRDDVARVRVHGDAPALRALREGRRGF